ncbi:hypothetical protein HYH02_003038 [Chlamydomonas schloesseri]|uniref:HNH nuclease domain-containing protein n=1 Tax=Chlamydomonas schloesseri TaxID=2026947 RepID=A0A835WSF4_9CHLO|nr:hypothetical protein HYH02_003038 [Chlamydomonas schloesseri]|eukprot:KAG2451996.1 hypothetical protein HYH02_003038 [Chlamydomonas schloesseri]
MVSRKEVAAALNAAAEARGVDGDELGRLLFALSKLSVEELDFFPSRANNKAIVAFARASAAGLGMGSAAGAGAAAGLGTTRAGDAGAAAGLGVGSSAGPTSVAGLGVGSAAGAEWTSTLKALQDMLPEMKAMLPEMKAMLPEMKAVLPEMKAMLPSMKLSAQLQLNQFEYTTSKASESRKGDSFKKQLQEFYSNSADAQCQLRCMLLNVKLPMTLVTGSHLFKYCWKPHLHILLGLSDINDPRNGLLLFKPLEHAFDDSRICFSMEEEAGAPKFRLELLDPSLKDVKLWDYAEQHNHRKGYDEHQIGSYAAEVTFGELQGKALVFEDANRPYKRCLQFQAVQALRRAKQEKWLPADWAPSPGLSYNSEDAKERIEAWLAGAVEAPPPDSDTKGTLEE